jgi:hypothetical protein
VQEFFSSTGSSEALRAIEQLIGSDLDGREIKLNEVKPKATRDNRGGGDGRW